MVNKYISIFLILLLVQISLGCINKDSDNDGYPDGIDALPKDHNYYLDSDGDGCADEIDAFPNNSRYKVESDRLKDTNDPKKLYQYGTELLEANNYEQSIEYFDKSLSIRYNEKVLNRKSNVLFQLHNYEGAIECADNVLKNNTTNTFALVVKGASLAKLGDFDQGIKYINLAIETDPDSQKLLEIKKMTTLENDALYGNDLTAKIKLDLTKMGYPNAHVEFTDQLKQIEIDIGKFESTTDSSPDLEPQLKYIAEEIGSSRYILESGYDTVRVNCEVCWNIEGDGTVGTYAHGSGSQAVYYHVTEAEITY